ncbi:hypothetical protein ACJJTC_014129 [Scirpophaga incertulas]
MRATEATQAITSTSISNRLIVGHDITPNWKLVKRCSKRTVCMLLTRVERNAERLMCSTLTRKWKSIRDNYIRESKRQKNLPSGSGSSKHVPYVYFAKLKFLESSVVNKDTENNFETPAVTNSDLNNAENEDLIPPPKEQTEGTRKKQKINAVDKQIVDILEKSLHARQKLQTAQLTNEDDDKLFCLSLYTELKKVPENRRLSTKIELLNVIQKAQNPALPQQTNQYQYQYAYSTPSYSGYTTARSSTPSQQWSATPPAPAPPPPTTTWVPSPSSQDSDSLHLFE